MASFSKAARLVTSHFAAPLLVCDVTQPETDGDRINTSSPNGSRWRHRRPCTFARSARRKHADRKIGSHTPRARFGESVDTAVPARSRTYRPDPRADRGARRQYRSWPNTVLTGHHWRRHRTRRHVAGILSKAARLIASTPSNTRRSSGSCAGPRTGPCGAEQLSSQTIGRLSTLCRAAKGRRWVRAIVGGRRGSGSWPNPPTGNKQPGAVRLTSDHAVRRRPSDSWTLLPARLGRTSRAHRNVRRRPWHTPRRASLYRAPSAGH